MNKIQMEKYPKEALKIGTFVRANRFNRLGVITDAFYGEKDEDDKEIVIYTVLMFPKQDPIPKQSSQSDQYYISNEYEYEVTAFLMMKPVDVKKLTKNINGGMPF
jgi:hypothetical protein